MTNRCEAIDDNYKYCGKPADWHAEWSDRELWVCDEHKDYAQECHDSDHEYDKTGIEWTKINHNEATVGMLNYLISKGCSELDDCSRCQIYIEYHKRKEDGEYYGDLMSLCGLIYGIKQTAKKQMMKR